MRLQLLDADGKLLADVGCEEAKLLSPQPGDILVLAGAVARERVRELASHLQGMGILLLVQGADMRTELLTDEQAAILRAALDARAAARAFSAATEKATEAVTALPADYEVGLARGTG